MVRYRRKPLVRFRYITLNYICPECNLSFKDQKDPRGRIVFTDKSKFYNHLILTCPKRKSKG